MIAQKRLFFIVSVLILTSFSVNSQYQEKWKVFHIDSIKSKEKITFLDTPTIAASLETVSKNHTLKASKYNRVVFILKGEGFALINQKRSKINKGDVVFVKSNETISILGNLKLMSWVSKSLNTNKTTKTQVFSEKSITSSRDSSENVWNRFINNATMSLGLYMLPKTLDGDDTLNHQVDEINFVINGSAKFKMNNRIINVKPGSIMWVRKGVGHYFYDLSKDFDVYILFEKTKAQ